MPLRRDERGARQNRQMRRHGVVRHREILRDVAGRQPFRFMLDQQAEDIEPGRLRERGEGEDGGG